MPHNNPAIDPTNPPGRRIGALVLVRDDEDKVLLVKPTYREGWILPGGGAEADESVHDAAAREAVEETGAYIGVGRLLVVDRIPADPITGHAEGYDFVFDGGRFPANTVLLPAPGEDGIPELDNFAFVEPADLDDYAKPYQSRRIRAALSALRSGHLGYLDDGFPA